MLTVENSGEILSDSAGIDATLAVPVTRLDADQYSADDIDGVTESIFGSGNMAYASLQAAQADSMIALSDALNLQSDYFAGQGAIHNKGLQVSIEESGAIQQIAGHVIPTDTDRSLETGDIANSEQIGAEGRFSNATVGALSASTLASDAGAFGQGMDSIGFESNANQTLTSLSAVVNNVINIISVDDTIQNIVTTLNETISNITNLGDEIIENILEGDIGGIINAVNNEVVELTENITTELNNTIDTVNNFLTETGIINIVNDVTEISDDITETVTNVLNGTLDDVFAGGISASLGTEIVDSLGTGLHIGIDDSIEGSIGADLVSGNVSMLTETLAAVEIPLVSGTGVNVGFDFLGDGPEDGNDIFISGVSTPDIDLGLAEGVIGDVDINVEVPEELSDPSALIEDVFDLAGYIDDVSLAEPEDIFDILGDQSAEGAFDIMAGDSALGDEFGVSADDAIADLTDELDIDKSLNIDEAIDILSASDSGLESDMESNSGDINWTESTIDAAGGMFDDIVSGIGGEADLLPDPGGTVAEGLGVLNMDLDSGGLGGLFG